MGIMTARSTRLPPIMRRMRSREAGRVRARRLRHYGTGDGAADGADRAASSLQAATVAHRGAADDEPGEIFGLAGRGTLAKGAQADVTIFDPKKKWTFDASQSLSKSRNTPFDGWRFTGRAVVTMSAETWFTKDRKKAGETSPVLSRVKPHLK